MEAKVWTHEQKLHIRRGKLDDVGIGGATTSVFITEAMKAETLENFCYLLSMTESKGHAEEPG